jgi:O-antigen ligase
LATQSRTAAAFGLAAAVVLGAGMPVLMAPASKSSPLLLFIAACLALSAAVQRDGDLLLAKLRAHLRSPTGLVVIVFTAMVALGVPFAHAPRMSALLLAQFATVAVSGYALALAFPLAAPRRRALIFGLGAAAAAAIIYADLVAGLWLRTVTGGRATTYTYNRGLVTLTVLLWPVLALILASRKLWLMLPIAALLPLAVFAGESQTAVVALIAGVAVFPIAALTPRFTRLAGLAMTLALLAAQPWIGTIMKSLVSPSMNQRFESAHMGDRIGIWLSFEAAAQARWLFGNGFGSSLNMQNAPVATLVPPERVTLLGASHPHNGLLQVWVELGLAGAALAAVLIVMLFQAIGRMRPALQPFALTCFAVIALVTLVSHGLWQAWWWAAILAAVASFATLEQELRRGEPPL